MKPGESEPWLGMARSLRSEGELEMANLAFAAAFEAEPTNPQLLWEQAENLRQAGKLATAQKVIQQIADGSWQPRFNWLQTQARAQLTGR
jgi:cytochrome c-type biogenesis protein CcmH/NrfG